MGAHSLLVGDRAQVIFDQRRVAGGQFIGLVQRQPSEHELRLAKRFIAEQEPGDIEALARLALALINLNEFLFVD